MGLDCPPNFGSIIPRIQRSFSHYAFADNKFEKHSKNVFKNVEFCSICHMPEHEAQHEYGDEKSIEIVFPDSISTETVQDSMEIVN